MLVPRPDGLSSGRRLQQGLRVEVLDRQLDALIKPLTGDTERARGWQRPQPVIPVDGSLAAATTAANEHWAVWLGNRKVRDEARPRLVRESMPKRKIDVRCTPPVGELEPPLQPSGLPLDVHVVGIGAVEDLTVDVPAVHPSAHPDT